MKQLLVSIGTLLLFSCASQRLSDVERTALYQSYLNDNKIEELDRITAFRFYGWRDIDNKHLIISTSLKKYYFITLRSSCVDLMFSQTIGINRSDSSLNAKFDSIFVPSFPRIKCHIKTIHKLTREQADTMDELENKVLEEMKKEQPSN